MSATTLMLCLTDRHIYTIVSTAGEPCSSAKGEWVLKPMKRVAYIAASWGNRFKLREIRRRLNEIGIDVSSQWIDFDRGYTETEKDELWVDEAFRDYDDIDGSDVLIIDTTDTNTRGGREWEAGYATGIGMRTVRVGPIITPFHASVSRSFKDWDSCISGFATEMEHANAKDN